MTRADRLSALDAVFLPMETRTQSLHVGSVLVVEGPEPDPDRFLAHVVAALAGWPIHRRRVLRMPFDLGRPVWVDAEGFDPCAQVHRAMVRPPGDEAALREAVVAIMGPRLDPCRPLWELWQVGGLADGRWAVVAKAHHTMVDGRSGVDVIQSVLTVDPAGAAETGVPAPRPVAGLARPAPSPAALLGELVAWLLLLPLRALRLLVRSLRAPRETRRRVEQVRFGLAQVHRPDLPPSVLNGPLGTRRTWGWTGADLAEVRNVARGTGCTVNDVFLAALAGGYRRYLVGRGEPLDAMVLRAIVPVSRRVPGQPARAGNLASAMFVELPVHLGDPGERLAAVAARTAEQKSHEVADATAAVVRLADHVPAALFALGARAYARAGQGRVNVVASNVTGPQEVRYLLGRRVLEIVPYVPVAEEIRASAAMVTYAGRLTIGVTGDLDGLPDVGLLVDAVGRELRDLVAGTAA